MFSRPRHHSNYLRTVTANNEATSSERLVISVLVQTTNSTLVVKYVQFRNIFMTT